MSGIFYAIGGANYEKNESLSIDLDILRQSNKKNPNVLLIPIANNDDLDKINTFKFYYEELGFIVDVLYSYNKELSTDEIKNAINNADIIYLSGGITSRLYEFAMKYNLKDLILSAYNDGKIIVGVSAGAIIFFEYGYGDKEAYVFNLETVNHQTTRGLAIFEGIFCPHYQNNGLLSFHDEVKKFEFNGYALENGSCLKICNEGFYIVKEKGSNAFIFNYKDNHRLQYLKNSILYKEICFKTNS